MKEVAHLIQEYQVQVEDSPGRSSHEDDYIMLLSYRCLGKGSPDDSSNTQYNRMKHALELFLNKHPWLDHDKGGVWLVSLSFLLLRLQSDQGLSQDIACIDQLDPDGKQRGINALPLIVAQCNAMISLTDATYLTRAWCGVEDWKY
jgi:hypothetical protein